MKDNQENKELNEKSRHTIHPQAFHIGLCINKGLSTDEFLLI